MEWGGFPGDKVAREGLTEEVTFEQDSQEVSEQAPWVAGRTVVWAEGQWKVPGWERQRCAREEQGAW